MGSVLGLNGTSLGTNDTEWSEMKKKVSHQMPMMRMGFKILNFSTGDFTLVIDHVTLEDDAVFQCQVGPGPEGIRELRSPNAKLTVEVPTGAPQILQGEFLQTTEDREIRLDCISRGGKPAAEV